MSDAIRNAFIDRSNAEAAAMPKPPCPTPGTIYHVRQYRPAYFTGFTDAVAHNLAHDQLTSPTWFRNFEGDRFDRWLIEPYGEELIIAARQTDGSQYVAGFAVDVTTPFASNWRYVAVIPAEREFRG